jgi:hypothetical protein
MNREELKALISEMDRHISQIPSLEALSKRDGATELMIAESLRQLNVATSRVEIIRNILDESGIDVEALRQENI